MTDSSSTTTTSNNTKNSSLNNNSNNNQKKIQDLHYWLTGVWLSETATCTNIEKDRHYAISDI